MNKSLQITKVRVIVNAKVERPIVVLETAQGIDVVRSPKLMLIDLQNSGRGLDIAPSAFDNGIENASQDVRASFQTACLDCIGATLTGDITERKAGDEYVVTGNHPALVDKNHKNYGKVKDGETLKAEKDGIHVEGFLSIPLTEQEKMRRDVSGNISKALMSMYGFGTTAPAPVAAAPVAQEAVITEAFETGAPASTKGGK